MKKILFIILVSILIVSCEQKKKYKTIDFGDFEITVPEQWNKLEFKGIDSYVGGIITPEKDSLIFDIGLYSGDASNDFPLVFDKQSYAELTKKQKVLLKKTKHLIVDSLSGDINFRKYEKYKFVFYTIDCFKAKITIPTNVGFGATGIYIDSLKGNSKDFNKIKMAFYGFDLKEKTQNQFVTALKTIKLQEYCQSEK
ncbi:MAG: hypothetical protein REI96_16240 [Flavobacterium nitrogenifigens]|uniref:hypothetical protein n=1 Tax=Flavobacterium nitrogenifigens TaxID=1617283 RepID=UPI002807F706|nr:hypothetical protein [Flavobacterium nitrogenifigens]MDQ8014004.1 hypothetical protein [Flavobacterium nitrogenifigens]